MEPPSKIDIINVIHLQIDKKEVKSPPVTCPPPPLMKGKNLGLMILKNGGELGNAGGNLISITIEFSFLKIKPS